MLRVGPTGIRSWRVQLPSRRWLTIGRIDEVALSDARETAQTRRAQAALGQDIPTRRPTSDVTLRAFLDDTHEAWMQSTPHASNAGGSLDGSVTRDPTPPRNGDRAN